MKSQANNFGKYHNKKVLISSNQSTADIIEAIRKHHNLYKKEYDKSALNFWQGNAESTAHSLFDFLKKNIQYKVEPKDEQTVKSPAAILHHGYGDCKHYASFIAGVVDALKRKGYPIDVVYRYASYKPGKDPHHVFAVVLDDSGREYWVDPVLPTFNNRKKYIKAIDKSAGIAGIGDLYSISGVDAFDYDDDLYDDYEEGQMAGRAERRARKAARQQRRAERREAKAARKEEKVKSWNPKRQARYRKRMKNKEEGKGIFRKIARGHKKISFAVSRNSFLLMLKMNLFRMASKLAVRMKDPANKKKILLKWQQLGGNPKQLEKDIARGVRVWNKRHPNKKISGTNALDEMQGLNKYGWAYDTVYLDDVGFCVDCSGSNRVNDVAQMGVAPAVGAAAIIAVASPVLAALASLFRGMGIDTSQMTAEAAEAEERMYSEEADDSEYYTEPYAEDQYGEYEEEGYYEDGDDSGYYEEDEYYEDPGDYEEYMGQVTAADGENLATVAKGVAKLFKRDPAKVAARQKRRAARRAAKGKAPKKIKVRTRNITKSVPLKAIRLPNGQPAAKYGRPVWDAAVRASHGEGTQRGLTIQRGPQGGQTFTDAFDTAKQWVNENPMAAVGVGLGALLIINPTILGGKKRRR